MVHGGALDNSFKNGALRIHFYLSPAIKQRNGHSVAELKRQDNNIHGTLMDQYVVKTRNFCHSYCNMTEQGGLIYNLISQFM